MSELEAGRELDAMVAERVMGARWQTADRIDANICKTRRLSPPADSLVLNGATLAWRTADGRNLIPDDGRADNLFHYSTDLAAAWQIVDAFTAKGWYVCVEHVDVPSRRWNAWFGDKNVYADSAPLAICRAALAAVLSHPDTSADT